MRIVRSIVVGALLTSALLLSGCKKKKPPVPAPQAQAPTMTEPAPQPAESKPEEAVPAEPQPTPPATEPSATVPPVTTKSTKPKSKSRVTDKPSAKKTPPAQPEKSKTVIDDTAKADAPQPPLMAEPSSPQTVQQRQQTAQLIQATEYNINNIKRTLSNDEQAIVQHIRSFVDQSKQATKDGDTERAYNLAVRAHLLSDSLKK